MTGTSPRTTGTVHLLAGLNGAGKTTHARRLEREAPAVRFSLDEWMLRLHGLRYDDPRYPKLAAATRDLIWDTARQVLSSAVDVVLDWNLWSRALRAEWAGRARAAGHGVVLHHVTATVATAIERAERRASAVEPWSHVLDEEAVRHLAGLFEVPTEAEGLEISRVDLD